MKLAVPGDYPFLPRFFRSATIAVLSNMMVPLAGLVDTAFLGHLSDIDYLAGVILGSIIFDYLYRVLKFLRSSTTALAGQAVGKNDEIALWQAGLRRAIIAIAIGLGMLLLQFPIEKISFTLLSGTAGVEQSGMDYFSARIWGAPAVLVNFVILGWLLGQERNGIIFLISLMINGSNVLLDYAFIYHWHWASAGAGWATALSQYLGLLIGVVTIASFTKLSTLKAAWQDIWNWAAFKQVMIFKGHIMLRFVILMTTFATFTNASSLFGTEMLALNGVLLQIAFFSQFTINGVGMTNQALVAQFKSEKRFDALLPVLVISLSVTLVMALSIALITVEFPQTIFSLLTNHSQITESVLDYSYWLIPLLTLTAITFMFEGYFIGLKVTKVLINAVLISFFFAYLPCVVFAVVQHNNHWLWGALVVYMASMAINLSWEVFSRFSPQTLAKQVEV